MRENDCKNSRMREESADRRGRDCGERVSEKGS